jgi:hypothetical protein
VTVGAIRHSDAENKELCRGVSPVNVQSTISTTNNNMLCYQRFGLVQRANHQGLHF